MTPEGSGTDREELEAFLATAPEPRNPRPVVLAPVPGEQQELELVALAAELTGDGSVDS